jgi:ligand-binding sensor domain-containing protein/signal transduction histidine kinase
LGLRRALLAIWILLPCFLPGRSFALDPAKSLFQFNCQNWNRQNGLPADKISSLTQSKDGHIWLGTQNGLVSFDGQDFKKFLINLPSAHGQDVRQVIAAPNGLIHFAIYNGNFGSYDGEHFLPLGDDRWAQRGVNGIAVLAARDGAIWTSGDMAYGRWQPQQPTTSFFVPATNGIGLSLYEDATGRIWLGTVEHGLFYWADGRMVAFPAAQLKGQNIFAVAVDAEKQVWVGTGNGLHCFYPNGQEKAIPAFAYEVKALLADRHGVVWVATIGEGLARYENGQFDFLKKVDGLGSDNVTALLEDAEGSLWVGTQDGLSQLSDVKFPIYSSKEGVGKGSVTAVAIANNGGLWTANYNGVTYFDGRKATNYAGEPLFPNNYIKVVFQARNAEVYAVDGAKNINVFLGGQLQARYANTVWTEALAEDSQSVLAGIGDALFRLQAGSFQPFHYAGPTPNYYWINHLCIAKDGAIWVASNNGVFRVQNGIFQQWSVDAGLSGPRVHWVCDDNDGSIWLGLVTGMARIKNGQLKNLTAQDGLPDDRVFAVVPDDRGYFWCDSGRGIFRVSRAGLNNFADGKTNRVDCELFDGLESVKSVDRTDQGSSGCKTADGRIWFPCPGGLIMIDPAHIPRNAIAPPVKIERVLANGREFARNENLVVPPGQGELEIHFSALSFIAPQKVRFRYQLEGYDENWVETEGRRLAFYTNLKPGRYTFRVSAANADGVWNKTGDVLKIELRPHFYQTIWFFLGCAALAVLGLAGIYAWRVRHLQRRQQALQHARDQLEIQVQRRTAELATANVLLKSEVGERERIAEQLVQRTQSLEAENEERKQMEVKLEETHRQLLEISWRAGMAEVASNVLHNIGNVLNSVNVSASLAATSVKNSRAANLAKVVALLREHAADLPAFLTHDPRGKKLPDYLAQLTDHLQADQAATVKELDSLSANIEHIKEIVAMQQSYAKVSGVKEVVQLNELVEDSLKMNAGAFQRHGVEVRREFSPVPPMNVEKHKILQILVNLVRNAKDACDESGRPDKRLTLRVTRGHGGVKISVSDNGAGIAPENLTRIFSHGFTTKKNGHGFGLHSGALAAEEMGGTLTAHSAGPGHGATFTLELPSP